MPLTWYLVVSALIFAIGAGGVLVRRNPLVILLCLELMLNGGNLALIAFSRMWGNGDGQILALVVMTVAACEVCIGLGMIGFGAMGGIARQPEQADNIRTAMLIIGGLVEGAGIIALVLCLVAKQ